MLVSLCQVHFVSASACAGGLPWQSTPLVKLQQCQIWSIPSVGRCHPQLRPRVDGVLKRCKRLFRPSICVFLGKNLAWDGMLLDDDRTKAYSCWRALLSCCDGVYWYALECYMQSISFKQWWHKCCTRFFLHNATASDYVSATSHESMAWNGMLLNTGFSCNGVYWYVLVLNPTWMSCCIHSEWADGPPNNLNLYSVFPCFTTS